MTTFITTFERPGSQTWARTLGLTVETLAAELCVKDCEQAPQSAHGLSGSWL